MAGESRRRSKRRPVRVELHEGGTGAWPAGKSLHELLIADAKHFGVYAYERSGSRLALLAASGRRTGRVPFLVTAVPSPEGFLVQVDGEIVVGPASAEDVRRAFRVWALSQDSPTTLDVSIGALSDDIGRLVELHGEALLDVMTWALDGDEDEAARRLAFLQKQIEVFRSAQAERDPVVKRWLGRGAAATALGALGAFGAVFGTAAGTAALERLDPPAQEQVVRVTEGAQNVLIECDDLAGKPPEP